MFIHSDHFKSRIEKLSNPRGQGHSMIHFVITESEELSYTCHLHFFIILLAIGRPKKFKFSIYPLFLFQDVLTNIK